MVAIWSGLEVQFLDLEITRIIYSIIDIETTGGKFNEERITEIAIFKIDDKGKTIKYHNLINPQKKIQPFVKKLTGISNEMLIDKPIFSDLAIEIDEFTKGSIFVAHNASFDYRVLKKEFDRINKKFKRKTLCTIELSKKVFPDKKSYSLGKLVSSLGIDMKNRHRADGDAEATLHLFKKISKKLNTMELLRFVRDKK